MILISLLRWENMWDCNFLQLKSLSVIGFSTDLTSGGLSRPMPLPFTTSHNFNWIPYLSTSMAWKYIQLSKSRDSIDKQYSDDEQCHYTANLLRWVLYDYIHWWCSSIVLSPWCTILFLIICHCPSSLMHYLFCKDLWAKYELTSVSIDCLIILFFQFICNRGGGLTGCWCVLAFFQWVIHFSQYPFLSKNTCSILKYWLWSLNLFSFFLQRVFIFYIIMQNTYDDSCFS